MKTHRPLTCEAACEMMFDYIDGLLEREDEEALTSHLCVCDKCRRELAERREMLSLVSLSERAVPGALYSKVMNSIADIPVNKKPLYARFGFASAAGLVGVCAMLAVFVLGRTYIFNSGAADMAANEAEFIMLDAVGNVSDDAGEVPEAAAEAEAADGASVFEYSLTADMADDADFEVYTASTAALTASSPLVTSAAWEADEFKTASDAAPKVMMKKALPASGNTSVVYTENSVIDSFFDKLNADPTDTAVIVCGDISVVKTLSPDETVIYNGGSFERYVFSDEPAREFAEYLEEIGSENVHYRAAMPDDGEIKSFELFVLKAILE